MTCAFCKDFCGNDWCSNSPTSEEIQRSKDEEFINMFNKNWKKSANYRKVEKWLKEVENDRIRKASKRT